MNRRERTGDGYQIPLEGFEDGISNSLFYDFLPYSGLREYIPEGTVYEDVAKNTPLLRLQGIRSLSFLSYHGQQMRNDYSLELSHTRLDHSLVVAMTTEHILRQNGFPQDKINIAIIAGLVHDIATPALGDATKKVDRESLDEEEHWAEVMGEEGIKLLKRYGTNQPEIDSIIKNQGILGQTLDVADRITYVMKDTYAVIGPVGENKTYVNLYANTGDLAEILNRFPEIGNIYQDVGVDQRKGDVFFNIASQLEAFLLLRALLHQKLYFHPISQAKDLFIVRLLEPLYSPTDQSKLTPALLRRMKDYDLLRIIGNKYFPSSPDPVVFFPDLVNWHPKFEKFEKNDEAEARAQQLNQDANVAVIGVQKSSGFDPATRYKVKDGNRTVGFREFNPTSARQIEAIAQSTKGVFLFYADVSEDSPTNTLLRKVLKP